MAALDEDIGKAVFVEGIYAVTARIDIRLKSMARVNEPLLIDARIVKIASRTVDVEARMKRRDGSIVAEAGALLFIVK